MHCSRVFRSSVPSDLSPSSPGRCRQAPLRVNAAALDQRNGGSAPVAECHIEGAVRQSCCPAGHIREGTLPGPVRSQGEGRTRFSGGGGARSRIGRTCSARRDVPGIGVEQWRDRDECAQRGQAGRTANTQVWALLGAPPVRGRGRQSPDQAGDMAAELVGWSSGELPSQGDRTAGLTAARHAVSRGPAAGRRVTSPLSCRGSSTFT